MIHCQACINEKYGLKAKSKHVCPKLSKNYTPPEISIIGDEQYVKVFFLEIQYQTVKATKFRLRAKQWINNYRVTYANAELWIPDHMFYNPHTRETTRSELYIWVKKVFYDKMAFV